MLKKFKKNNKQENLIYDSIVLLSRNKLFYTNFNLSDTFQNRIHLIFIHISFLFIKIKQNNDAKYKNFYQNIFDLTFKRIELNMREIGYGDTRINRNMKILVKNFYNILLFCENFRSDKVSENSTFFLKYLEHKKKKVANNDAINRYFIKYQAFCIDLRPDSVLKGELNFNYNKEK